jgi:hypothetical protein
VEVSIAEVAKFVEKSTSDLAPPFSCTKSRSSTRANLPIAISESPDCLWERAPRVWEVGTAIGTDRASIFLVYRQDLRDKGFADDIIKPTQTTSTATTGEQ